MFWLLDAGDAGDAGEYVLDKTDAGFVENYALVTIVISPFLTLQDLETQEET